MIKAEQALGQKNSLTYTGKLNPNATLYGQYTGRLPVFNSDGNEVINLWFMDSRGDYGCEGNYNGKSCISKDAVTWFTSEQTKTKTNGPGDLVFTTYPLPEFMDAINQGSSLKGNIGQ